MVLLLSGLVSFGCPHYNVWDQGMAGRAKLAEAKQSRMIKIEEAKAAEQSATLLAKAKLAQAKGDAAAEVERAKGVAMAMEAVGAKLRELGPEYTQWRWVEGLNDGNTEVIYVATEAGIPILEAGKRLGRGKARAE